LKEPSRSEPTINNTFLDIGSLLYILIRAFSVVIKNVTTKRNHLQEICPENKIDDSQDYF